MQNQSLEKNSAIGLTVYSQSELSETTTRSQKPRMIRPKTLKKRILPPLRKSSISLPKRSGNCRRSWRSCWDENPVKMWKRRSPSSLWTDSSTAHPAWRSIGESATRFAAIPMIITKKKILRRRLVSYSVNAKRFMRIIARKPLGRNRFRSSWRRCSFVRVGLLHNPVSEKLSKSREWRRYTVCLH